MSPNGRTAPPPGTSRRRGPPEPPGGRWGGVGGAEAGQAGEGAERLELDATGAERTGGAGGRWRRAESDRGSRGSGADPARGGCGESRPAEGTRPEKTRRRSAVDSTGPRAEAGAIGSGRSGRERWAWVARPSRAEPSRWAGPRKNRLGPPVWGNSRAVGGPPLYPAAGTVVVRGVAAEENSLTNFGLLIAYVLPGFTALEGFPLIAPAAAAWGTGGDPNPPLTAFLSGTVMALAAGLTVSTVRWLVIDSIHRKTGVRRPDRDFARLETNVAAFRTTSSSPTTGTTSSTRTWSWPGLGLRDPRLRAGVAGGDRLAARLCCSSSPRETRSRKYLRADRKTARSPRRRQCRRTKRLRTGFGWRRRRA